MFTTVSDSKQVAKLQRKFAENLCTEPHEIKFVSLGHQGAGGSIPSKVYYFPRLDFWFSEQNDYNRFWNAFGLGNPSLRQNLNIVCEINFPHEGINRKIAGVFAVDGNKSLILHRGKIGGGRKGIGKSLFKAKYSNEWLYVEDGGNSSKLAIVGDLNQSILPRQVQDFVRQVARIKSLDDEQKSEEIFEEHSFTEEFSGIKQGYQKSNYVEPLANHGIIVSSLRAALSNLGYSVHNNNFIDLYILESHKIMAIFEIKTSISSQDVYSAIGQALFYSVKFTKSANKILVLPFCLDRDVEDILVNGLGLTILYYEWDGDRVNFLNLEAKL